MKKKCNCKRETKSRDSELKIQYDKSKGSNEILTWFMG